MKLNLGCGPHPMPSDQFPEMYNVDLVNPGPRSYPYHFIQGDLFDVLGPMPDDFVDHITLHHTLEHFTYEEGSKLLRECYRVLRPLHRLTVVVPDFRAVVDAYRSDPHTLKANIHWILGGEWDEAGRWHKGRHAGMHHGSAYDMELLTSALRGAGFSVTPTLPMLLPYLVSEIAGQIGASCQKPAIVAQ